MSSSRREPDVTKSLIDNSESNLKPEPDLNTKQRSERSDMNVSLERLSLREHKDNVSLREKSLRSKPPDFSTHLLQAPAHPTTLP